MPLVKFKRFVENLSPIQSILIADGMSASSHNDRTHPDEVKWENIENPQSFKVLQNKTIVIVHNKRSDYDRGSGGLYNINEIKVYAVLSQQEKEAIQYHERNNYISHESENSIPNIGQKYTTIFKSMPGIFDFIKQNIDLGGDLGSTKKSLI